MTQWVMVYPPVMLVRGSVAAVWLYEGLWCKLLRKTPGQVDVVEAVPKFGRRWGALFLMTLGVVEVGLAAWVISGVSAGVCALTQTVLLVTLNANGLVWARRLIHEPLGMVVKNASFLVLVWVGGAMTAGTV